MASPSATDGRAGELDFGPDAAIDYDELVLDFHDHYLRGIANRFATQPPVRYFVMGANEWRDAGRLAAPASRVETLYLDAASDGGRRRLQTAAPAERRSTQQYFTADPTATRSRILTTRPAPHDYRALESRARTYSRSTASRCRRI